MKLTQSVEPAPAKCPICRGTEFEVSVNQHDAITRSECADCGEYAHKQLGGLPRNDGVVQYTPAGGFASWTYTLYGEDNRARVFSRGFSTMQEAAEEARKELARVPSFKYGYVYPPSVRVAGRPVVV